MQPKIITLPLFGEDVDLKYTFLFSRKLRLLYPNWEQIFSENEIEMVMLASVRAALPEKFNNKTEEEVADAIYALEDPAVLSECLQSCQDAIGFFVSALSGIVKATQAVQEGAKPKSKKALQN